MGDGRKERGARQGHVGRWGPLSSLSFLSRRKESGRGGRVAKTHSPGERDAERERDVGGTEARARPIGRQAERCVMD